jgi:hypothetical protein
MNVMFADDKNAFMVCVHNRQEVSRALLCGGLGRSQSFRAASRASTFSSALETALIESLIKEELKVKLQNFLYLVKSSRMAVARSQLPSVIK